MISIDAEPFLHVKSLSMGLAIKPTAASFANRGPPFCCSCARLKLMQAVHHDVMPLRTPCDIFARHDRICPQCEAEPVALGQYGREWLRFEIEQTVRIGWGTRREDIEKAFAYRFA